MGKLRTITQEAVGLMRGHNFGWKAFLDSNPEWPWERYIEPFLVLYTDVCRCQQYKYPFRSSFKVHYTSIPVRFETNVNIHGCTVHQQNQLLCYPTDAFNYMNCSLLKTH